VSRYSRIPAAAPKLVGLVVSGLVYWALSRSLDLAAERAVIEASDHELEALER
jgi:NCS1 family nucleobase:cation symporter-1